MFKVYNLGFGTLTYCKMITTIVLAHTLIALNDYNFLLLWECLRFTFLTTFKYMLHYIHNYIALDHQNSAILQVKVFTL